MIDIDEMTQKIYACLNVDNPVFFHGGSFGNDYSGKEILFSGPENTRELIEEMKLDGKTIKMCLTDNIDLIEPLGFSVKNAPVKLANGKTRKSKSLESPDYMSDKQARAFYNGCSAPFSFHAKGDIICIEGDDTREDGTPEDAYPSTYREIELPIMMLMKQVESITKICPVTGNEKDIVSLEEEWQRMYPGDEGKIPTPDELKNMLRENAGENGFIRKYLKNVIFPEIEKREQEKINESPSAELQAARANYQPPNPEQTNTDQTKNKPDGIDGTE